jgi:glutamate carboxypeptidase
MKKTGLPSDPNCYVWRIGANPLQIGTAIVATAKKQLSETEALLEKIVNINSGTNNKEGVRTVGKLLAEEFDKLGFKTEWITFPDSIPTAGHLVATRQGTKGKKLFLIGHLDTVFEKSLPMEPFKRTSDSTATGQGALDMKGGDVAIIAALKALQAHKLLDDSAITVYFTGDEETGGGGLNSPSRRDFIERARGCDLALSFEVASGLNKVSTGMRGISTWSLSVKARSGQSARIFGDMGYGAIYEIVRILNEFRKVLGQEPNLTFSPGLLVSGAEVHYDDKVMKADVAGKVNIIPGTAYAKGDLRFLLNAQKVAAQAKMQEIVEKSLPLTKATITFTDLMPNMEPAPANDGLRKELEKVNLAMGLGPVAPVDPGIRGSADIAYVAQYLPCLSGIGASGSGQHSIEETINLREYPLIIQRTAVLLYRLTR